LELEKQIFKIFKKSRNNYGSRKIKKELEKIDIIVSLRKIRTIMKKNGLVSNYTIKQFKVIKSKYNEDGVENILNREFNREKNMDVIVSDLTYVNVAGKWNYICLILDLYNREIVGYAAGRNKTASLVYKAFSTIRFNLNKVSLFHTDRGNEFKNKVIDELLCTFGIRLLSYYCSLQQNHCLYHILQNSLSLFANF
jgi:putative transposase